MIHHWGGRVRWSLTGLLVVFAFAAVGCSDDDSAADDAASPSETTETDVTDTSGGEDAEESDGAAEAESDLSGELRLAAPGDDQTIADRAAMFSEDHPDVAITVDGSGGEGIRLVCDGVLDAAFSNETPSNLTCQPQTEQVAGLTAHYVEETELLREFLDYLAE